MASAAAAAAMGNSKQLEVVCQQPLTGSTASFQVGHLGHQAFSFQLETVRSGFQFAIQTTKLRSTLLESFCGSGVGAIEPRVIWLHQRSESPQLCLKAMASYSIKSHPKHLANIKNQHLCTNSVKQFFCTAVQNKVIMMTTTCFRANEIQAVTHLSQSFFVVGFFCHRLIPL